MILVQNRCDGGLGERLRLLVDDAVALLRVDHRLFTRVAYSAKDEERPTLRRWMPCSRP